MLFRPPTPKVVPVSALSRRRPSSPPRLAPAAAVALALAACTPHEPEPKHHVVGELKAPVHVKEQPDPTPPQPQIPPVAEPEPETYELMGDVAAVEDEPCDPPPRPTAVKMGKIKRR